MDRRSNLPPPLEVAAGLTEIGQAVRAARLRRQQSMQDLAGRIGVSLPTLRKLERGDPTVSLGTFVTALWVLNLLDGVREAVHPGRDRVAGMLEADRLSGRARRKREVDLDRL
jgi:transcriptional regulator with XRE-family HTH domain